jgi:hypothetical protein
MKPKRRILKSIFVLLLLYFVIGMVHSYFQQKTPNIVKNDPFADVKKYGPIIKRELAKNHLEYYTPVLEAIMQQESQGKGGDPMQASESLGLGRNTVKDPKQSIQLGVKYFQRVLTYGNKKKVDIPTVIQAYNMGIGYIDYVAQHGGKHSEQLAKQFSLLQVQKKPAIYTCSGNKNNFRYPYCYGDFTYSTKVSKNIQLLADSIPVTSSKNKIDGSS